jgi:hypothetical protein
VSVDVHVFSSMSRTTALHPGCAWAGTFGQQVASFAHCGPDVFASGPDVELASGPVPPVHTGIVQPALDRHASAELRQVWHELVMFVTQPSEHELLLQPQLAMHLKNASH